MDGGKATFGAGVFCNGLLGALGVGVGIGVTLDGRVEGHSWSPILMGVVLVQMID